MNMLHICSNFYAYVTTSQKHICHMCALQMKPVNASNYQTSG